MSACSISLFFFLFLPIWFKPVLLKVIQGQFIPGQFVEKYIRTTGKSVVHGVRAVADFRFSSVSSC